MIRNYLKIAWRNIKKHRIFSAINAGGLCLGMASCLLLLLYVSYHLNFDHQSNKIDRTYMIENNQPGDGKMYTFASTPGGLAGAIKTSVPGVEEAVRSTKYTADGLVTYRENSFKKSGLFADAGFFQIFSNHFIYGDVKTALSRPDGVVITQDLATALFGNTNPMDKAVLRNNKTALTVTAVIENMPENSSFQFDYVLPWAVLESENSWVKTSGWGNNFCQTVVLLKNAAYFNQADGAVRRLMKQEDSKLTEELMLFPYAQLHLYSKFENGKSVGGLIDLIRLFVTLAFGILLIACVNFMNLSTARSEERAKEVGIRKAIGSGRQSLIWQFITESVLLSLISMTAAMILIIAALPYFNQLLNIQLVLPLNNLWFWLGIIFFTLITGIMAGSYPAFYLSSFEPIKVLKGTFKGSTSALPVRKILVIIQFVFAVFLITSTICIYRQIKFVQEKSVGFDRNGLVQIKMEGNLLSKSNLLINQLKANGDIINGSSFSQSITKNGNNTFDISWPGKQINQLILFDTFSAGYDFVATAGLKLLNGRAFSDQYPADTLGQAVIVNRSAITAMNLKNPIGEVVKYSGNPVTIVGIFEDFVWGSPYKKTVPMMVFCSNHGRVIGLRLNAHRPVQNNIAGIEKALKEINPAFPPELQFVDADFEKKFQNEQLLSMLANLFGSLAIIISCLGLFGLATYAAEQRTKEIGVRKVLGATVSNLIAMLSRDFLKMVLIAVFIAIPISVFALNKWLENYDYRITLSWWMMALAGIVTLAIALATVSYQAIKAALANPVKSLRSE